ncbi:MAG: DNA-binding protein WhiA [Firmicutes bacterium]|nr:DNA-binding protein WhiA [Bacillota bacterium]
MSFTSQVKEEISKLASIETDAISELSALLRNLATIREKSIQITTENESVSRRIFELVKTIYDVNSRISVRNGYNFNKNFQYVLEINQKKEEILEDLSITSHGKMLMIPKNYIYDDFDLRRSYLRGLFLAVGSINDPKTSRYHLEFIVNDMEYADFISELLNSFKLNSKTLKRDNKYMIYMKESEKIGDFLRIIGANNAILYYEDIRIYREEKNRTNRLNNCEQANVEKLMETAFQQLKDIEYLKEKDAYSLLDEKVTEVCAYREKYPEVSLLELSEIISMETGNKITKSGLHHRFKKLKDIANKIRKQNNEKERL